MPTYHENEMYHIMLRDCYKRLEIVENAQVFVYGGTVLYMNINS